MRKNKKGWIKIVEAFISILIIITVVLIVANKGSGGNKDLSSEIYPIEKAILKEIELNQDFRNKILSIPAENLPVEWDKFEENGLSEVKNKITTKIPTNLECSAKICDLSGTICDSATYVEKDIYAQSIPIAAEIDTYSPRQLKLFCNIR